MAEIGSDIVKAKDFLSRGEVVGIPTETVYGLAGNALDEQAIVKIYAVKNRPKFDPLIAHVDELAKVEQLVKNIPEEAKVLASKFWPGPLTILLDRKSRVPDLLTSGLDRVAVRIPNHPLTLELLSTLDFPLAAPSANPFGYVSPTTAQHVEDQLGDEIPYILDGGSCQVGLESTIVGFEQGETIVYRLGGTQVERLIDAVGDVKIQVNASSDPTAPGMLKSHYSPGKNMIIGDIATNLAVLDPKTTGIISFHESFGVPNSNEIILSKSGNIDEAAQNIFSALRSMDQPHIRVILCEYLPEEGLGKAINDRLKRAAV